MSRIKENVSPPTELIQVTLTGNKELSPGVHLISWKRKHDFEPGMVVKLTINNEIVPRIYSICSGKDEAEISVLFHIKEDGLLTPRLARVQEGMTVWVTEPYGSFLDRNRPAWWIATGTGIAPFYSMLRSGMVQDRTLLHGVRSLDQFYFDNEFDQALGNRYIRCCAHESSDNVFPGRVSTFLEQIDELPTESDYYLCGKAIMVVEVRDLLIARGIPYEHILSEIYF